MNEADRIWDESDDTFSCLGLREIPFSESASTPNLAQLCDVFTGRENELREVFSLFRSRERKRILIYGWAGIGKTAFILQVLNVLQRKARNTLTAYINLPPEADLATAAFIALAREMEDDEWAQQMLNEMGLRPRKPLYRRKGKVEVSIPIFRGGTEEEPLSIAPPQFPTLCFEDLLERAYNQYSRVVIAIDDLDKQDPARARQLLHDAQGILKGQAWFILTGHPSGLTRDILIRERGLFDLPILLKALDQETTRHMLANYLNSARVRNVRYDPSDPHAFHPFTLEAAYSLCEYSRGVPRWLNRFGCYVLLKASNLHVPIITFDILQKGFDYSAKRLLGQSNLTAEEHYVLELVLEKGNLSDSSITLTDLEQVRTKEFSEILPILEKLVQLDLVRRLPTERSTEYEPNPILLGKYENQVDYAELEQLWNSVKKTRNRKEKGKLLEDFIEKLLGKSKNFRIIGRNIRSDFEEIDIMCTHKLQDIFKKVDPVVLIECKNWSKKAGKDELVTFFDKVKNRRPHSNLGIFISVNGFTKGVSDFLKSKAESDVKILLISDGDIDKMFAQGRGFLALLEDKFTKNILLMKD